MKIGILYFKPNPVQFLIRLGSFRYLFFVARSRKVFPRKKEEDRSGCLYGDLGSFPKAFLGVPVLMFQAFSREKIGEYRDGLFVSVELPKKALNKDRSCLKKAFKKG